jgi:hypothetical protein
MLTRDSEHVSLQAQLSSPVRIPFCRPTDWVDLLIVIRYSPMKTT